MTMLWPFTIQTNYIHRSIVVRDYLRVVNLVKGDTRAQIPAAEASVIIRYNTRYIEIHVPRAG